MPADRQPRLDSLTGLRFAAAALVVLYHCSRYLLPETSAFLGLGYVGVTFFFVLSGFILTWTHDDEEGRGRFYWKRFTRIYPLHLLTTIIAAVLLLIWTGAIPIAQLFPVLTLTQAWIPPGEWKFAYNGPSWSLSDEAFFYLLFPLIAVFAAKRSTRGTIGLGAAAAAAMVAVAAAVIAFLPAQTWDALTYTNPAFRLGEFVVGVALGTLVRKGWRPAVPRWVGVAAFLIPLVGLYALVAPMYSEPWDMPFVVSDLVVLPGVVMIILSFARSDLDGKRGLFATPPLVKLGEWSFALYLINELVIHVVAQLVPKGPAAVVIMITISLLLAWALYTYFERPVERRLRKLVGARQRVEAVV